MHTSKTEATDPICGMIVDTATAIHAELDGKLFYFCGEHCRTKVLAASAGSKQKAKTGGCCG